jgi:hypothetical protein
MTNFRGIKSPVALATCGMFLVPEPFGACLLLAAAVWWLWRKTGCPWRGMLSSFREGVRRGLHSWLVTMRIKRGTPALTMTAAAAGSGAEAPEK